MKKYILLLFLFTMLVSTLSAQQIPVDQETVQNELKKRGLKEDDVRKKLLEKGIDINNIDASQLPDLEQALEDAVRELEEENQNAVEETTEKILNEEIKEVAKDAAVEIQESVEDGATVEEAIAEELIEEATEDLPDTRIYGQQLFRDKTLKVFSPSEDVAPPDSYILGPGDKINISIWGVSQEDATFAIDKEGKIKPSGMNRISLKGLSFGQAKKKLQSRFSQFYRFRPEEFEVTITYSRTITVNIYGEVFSPGSFTIPATNTAFNALIAAGGPSNIGSVRNIRLIRAGVQSKRIDVYEFMIDPTVQEEFYLQANDIIHVGVMDKLVTINGAIRRPFKYELLEGEELKQLIKYAGGLQDNAYQGNIQIKRFEDDKEKIFDVKLNDLLRSNSDFKLLSGDEVTVLTIPEKIENFVKISGAVEFPNNYEISAGMRIKDLLDKGVLSKSARTDVAFLIHVRSNNTVNYEKINIDEILQNPSNPSNRILAPRDQLQILSQTSYVDKATISVAGAVRNPSQYTYDPEESLRIDDAILLAGGLKPGATNFAYLHRTDPKNRKEKEYIRVDLAQIIADSSSSENLELKPFDRLVVYSNSTFFDKSTVRVSGAVKNPGEFIFDETLSLTDVLTMAGGLRLQAATNRVEIFRVVIQNNDPTETIVATLDIDEDLKVSGDEFNLEPFDQIVVRNVPDFEFQQIVTIEGEVRYPGPYPLISDNEKLVSVLNRSGGLTKEAFPDGVRIYRVEGSGVIIPNLKEALRNNNSEFNFILKRGDRIVIPKVKDLVGIQLANTKAGEVYPDKTLSQGKFRVAYSKGKNAKYYLDEYTAGISEKGRKRLITVEHANGKIERTKNFILFKKYPKIYAGSVISVGKKREKVKEERSEIKREPVDWGKVISNSIAQVTAVLTLVILVQRLD